MPIVRHTVRFTGHVQGVGFRFTTCRVAEQYNVAGWVRNDPDGAVTCVIEGETDELNRFVEAVKAAMRGHVAQTEITPGPATGEFAGFSIRR